MGRKSALTPETADRIEAAIKAHAPLNDAARHGGVSPATFFRWMAEGEQAQSGQKREFYERMERAKADSKIGALARIQKSAIGGTVKSRKTVTTTKRDGTSTTTVTETFYEPQWTADAWLLERRYPREFARLSRTELTGRDGAAIEIDTPDEQRRESVVVKLSNFQKRRKQQIANEGHDEQEVESDAG